MHNRETKSSHHFCNRILPWRLKRRMKWIMVADGARSRWRTKYAAYVGFPINRKTVKFSNSAAQRRFLSLRWPAVSANIKIISPPPLSALMSSCTSSKRRKNNTCFFRLRPLPSAPAQRILTATTCSMTFPQKKIKN